MLSINCAKRFYFFKPDSDVIFHSICLAHTHNHKRARGATRSNMLLASLLSCEQQLEAWPHKTRGKNSFYQQREDQNDFSLTEHAQQGETDEAITSS